MSDGQQRNTEGWKMNTGLEMTAGIVNITPVQAARWLKRNKNYRKPRAGYEKQLAVQMREGRWLQNGESIKFDTNDNLVDGQHRLAACVRAGVSFVSVVIGNVHSDLCIDIGSKRSFSDYLASRKEINSNNLAAAIKNLWIMKNKQPGKFDVFIQPSQQEMIAELHSNPGIRNSVKESNAVKQFGWQSSWAALHYLFSEKDKELASAFLNCVVKPYGLAERDPVVLLRNRMDKEAKAKTRLPRKEQMALIITAWNAWRENKEIRMLRWRAVGPAAQPFPEIV